MVGFEQVEEGDESDASVGGELGKVRVVLSGCGVLRLG